MICVYERCTFRCCLKLQQPVIISLSCQRLHPSRTGVSTWLPSSLQLIVVSRRACVSVSEVRLEYCAYSYLKSEVCAGRVYSPERGLSRETPNFIPGGGKKQTNKKIHIWRIHGKSACSENRSV